MPSKIINKEQSCRIVMTGVYYEHNHPGGISAVIQYWSKYIEGLQYYPMFKEGGKATKLLIFVCSVIKLFFKLLFDRKVRIVHVHTAADSDFDRSTWVVNMAKLFGKKVIIHSHASRFKDFFAESTAERKKKILAVLKKADVLIVLSESWKDWFIGIGVEADNITILHNITSYPNILPGDKRTEDSPIRLLFLGEIGQRKGVFDILRALANHKEELEGKMELRIGGNKMENELQANIKNNGLAQMVKFEGFVSGDKKIELLNWADVYILPSFNEGLPISILEAMSYSMPIISTPVGGIPEVVDGNNGILVTPGNDEEIYAAIKKYIDNPELLDKEGKVSYDKVETYLPDYVMNHLKNIYASLI